MWLNLSQPNVRQCFNLINNQISKIGPPPYSWDDKTITTWFWKRELAPRTAKTILTTSIFMWLFLWCTCLVTFIGDLQEQQNQIKQKEKQTKIYLSDEIKNKQPCLEKNESVVLSNQYILMDKFKNWKWLLLSHAFHPIKSFRNVFFSQSWKYAPTVKDEKMESLVLKTSTVATIKLIKLLGMFPAKKYWTKRKLCSKTKIYVHKFFCWVSQAEHFWNGPRRFDCRLKSNERTHYNIGHNYINKYIYKLKY